MLARIRDFFAAGDVADVDKPSPELAAAALLVEVARSDYHVDEREEQLIAEQLRTTLGLSTDEIESLLELAHTHSRDAVGLHPFTSVIHDHFTVAEKTDLFIRLWRVAFADGRIDRYEEHMLRRIAELLHLPHREFIRTKLDVQAEHAG